MSEQSDNIIYLNSPERDSAILLTKWSNDATEALVGKRITALNKVFGKDQSEYIVLALDSGDTFFVARGAIEEQETGIRPGYIFDTAIWSSTDESKWNADAFEELTDTLPSQQLQGRTIIAAKYLNEEEVDDIHALFVNGREGPFSVLLISLDDGTHWSVSADKRFSFPGALLPIMNANAPDKPSDLPRLPAVTLSGQALVLG